MLGCVGLCWVVLGCVLCVGCVVCRTHSQDHGIHIHVDVRVGVTLFAHFLKTQSRTRTFHDVCFSKPLTFDNGFMFFASTFSDVKPLRLFRICHHFDIHHLKTIEKTWNMGSASHHSDLERTRKSHCVNTITDHRDKKNTQRRGILVAHMPTHTLTFHDNHYHSHLCFSLLCSSRNFVDNSVINSLEDDKGRTNQYSGNRKDNSKTFCFCGGHPL